MRYAILFLLSFSAVADSYDDWDDPALSGMRPRDEPLVSPSRVDRYFGGNDPAVVVPMQPGSGPSYIGQDQVMTDHQYCYRSAVSGAMICQSH